MERSEIRWLVGIGGAATMIAVLVWGLVEDTESIAIIAFGVGAFFLYVAYSGQKVSAFKAGGMEATLAAAVTQTLRDPEVPEEVKERISEQVQDQRLPPPLRQATQQVLSRRALAMQYEAGVGTALTRLGGADWKVISSSGRQPFDFEVTRTGDSTVVRVECRWSAGVPTEHQLNDWMRTLDRVGRLGDGCLLVTPSLPPGAHRDGLVAWQGRSGEDDCLVSAINDAFS